MPRRDVVVVPASAGMVAIMRQGGWWRRLGRRAKAHGHTLTAEHFERQAEQSQRSAAVLRALIDDVDGTADEDPRVARTT